MVAHFYLLKEFRKLWENDGNERRFEPWQTALQSEKRGSDNVFVLTELLKL